MPLFSYERWNNFDKAISRAIDSCQATGIEVSDHFREITKMVKLGSGSKRKVKDYMLTRYAYYLIAQNSTQKKGTSQTKQLRLNMTGIFLPSLKISHKLFTNPCVNAPKGRLLNSNYITYQYPKGHQK